MKKVISKLDKPLLLLTIVFFIFGIIMIFSASNIVSIVKFNKQPYNFLIRQCLFVFIGLIAFLFIIFINTKNYNWMSKFYMLGVIGLLAGLIIYGQLTNSVKSWYYIGPFSLQPSEFAKTALIMYLGCYYNNHKSKLNNQWTAIYPLIIACIIFFLVFLQPDLGTAIIIAFICIFIFFALPLEKQFKGKMFTAMIVVTLLVSVVFLTMGKKILTETQIDRFNFFNPCDRYTESTGYQVCNGYMAINSGGLFGVGLGNSTQKYLYLPEAHTDFIFAILVEELGVIGGICTVIFYIFILFRILMISKNATNLRNSIIAYGVFAYILLHIVVNLVGVLGLFPLTGIPLPFLSYGGSSTLNIILALGIVQRIAVENKETKKI